VTGGARPGTFRVVRLSRPAALAVPLVLLTGQLLGGVPAAAGDRGTDPAPMEVAGALPGDAPNPCVGEDAAQLRCPDLMMRRPFGLQTQRTRTGRVLLRAGNAIDSVGVGPAELRGVRTSARWMRAQQVIRRVDGGVLRVDAGARLEYKRAHQNRSWWKFHDAARFELWTTDLAGTPVRRVRTGPKVAYCLRDLELAHRELGGPRREVYPPCSTNRNRRRVTLGTSTGWSDVYPPRYPEQYIDVTGLRGCFAYVHTADPSDGIRETDETNNVARVIVRLPFRASDPRGGCAGRQVGVRYSGAGGVDAW
jgi:hypothetical protein